MSKILCRMLGAAIQQFFSRDPGVDLIFPKLTLIDGRVMREKKIDCLEVQVTDYPFQIMRQELSTAESAEVFTLLNIVKDQEALGDVIEVRMMQLLWTQRTMEIVFSKEGEKETRALHEHVCSCMQMLTEAIEGTDTEKAEAILKNIKDFDQLELLTEHQHLRRLIDKVSVSEMSHNLRMELVDSLKQILFYCGAMTKNLFYKR